MRQSFIWSSSDVETVLRLNAEGKSDAEIGELLGRSSASIKGKIEYLALTPEQREVRRSAINRRRQIDRQRFKSLKPMDHLVFNRALEPTQIEERAQRSLAPARDLTAFLMGDPPVGYSALERRA